jgi:hypothetical protein
MDERTFFVGIAFLLVNQRSPKAQLTYPEMYAQLNAMIEDLGYEPLKTDEFEWVMVWATRWLARKKFQKDMA